MNLVRIDNIAENNFLRNTASRYSAFRWSSYAYGPWIGLFELNGNKMNWKWNGSCGINYTNWDFKEPNNGNSREHCAHLYKVNSGRWNDIDCYASLPFICEKYSAQEYSKNCDTSAVYKYPPYSTYKGRKYYFSREILNYNSARARCRELNMHLVHIKNAAENNFIYHNYAKSIGTGPWIGLHESYQEGDWKWDDGCPLQSQNYINWNSGQPNDLAKNQDCAQIRYYYNGKWNDWSCSTRETFVCEEKSHVSSCPGVIKSNQTASHKTTYNGHEYLFVSERKTYAQAVSECLKQGMKLVRIDNVNENNYLWHTASRYSDFKWFSGSYGPWIGLSEVDGIELNWRWNQSCGINYTNWDLNEPNNGNNKENCAHFYMVSNGRWNDLDCNVKLPFICEKYSSGDYSGKCQNTAFFPPYYKYNGRKYYFSPEKALYNIAKSRCRQLNMRLVHVDSDTENNFLYTQLKKSKRLIGTGPWIGLYENYLEGQWQWDDGCRLQAHDYSNWGFNQPNDLSADQDCTQIPFYENGKWNDWSCSLKETFICEEYSKPSCLGAINTSSSEHKAIYNGHEYLFVSRRRTFMQAVTECKNYGMKLARIDDHKENEFLWKTASRFGKFQWFSSSLGPWIGLSEINGMAMNWKWNGSCGINYTNWDEAQPDNANRKEHCAHFYKVSTGKWNDIDCTIILPFICEKYSEKLYYGKCNSTALYPPFYNFNGRKYYFSAEKLNYSSARMRCRQLRMHLVHIDNIAENNFIYSKSIKSIGTGPWIGLFEYYQEGQWQWDDGCKLRKNDFTFWYPSQPNQAGNQDCAQMRFDYKGRWNDWECAKQETFVCEEFSKISCSNSAYIKYGNHEYYFGKTLKTRAQAAADCENRGMRLVRINDALETNFLRTTSIKMIFNGISSQNGQTLWIGLKENSWWSGTWLWHDNCELKPKSWKNWATGKPNNNDVCVELLATGKWNSVQCNKKLPYVCEEFNRLSRC